jgi:hypothetical protein
MIIVATEEGIEVDGILLKSTAEMQCIIAAHQPETLSVQIDMHAPFDLEVLMRVLSVLTQGVNLSVLFGLNAPHSLPVYITALQPLPLEVLLGMHSPADLQAQLYGVPYYTLDIFIEPAHLAPDLYALIGCHAPRDLTVMLGLNDPYSLYVLINPTGYLNLYVSMRIFQTGTQDLNVYLKGVHSDMSDFTVSMYIWSLHQLQATIGAHDPMELTISMHVWTPSDWRVLMSTVFPEPLEVGFTAAPEDGVNMIVLYRTFQPVPLTVELYPWEHWMDLSAYFYGYYASPLSVTFTMGSYRNLEIILPMRTGYRDFVVTLAPASRVMSTFIPIYTMEIKDLYISINQGWPCGFGSSYALLEVYFDLSYVHPFNVIFKVIHGSGIRPLGVWLWKSYFDSYLNTFRLDIVLPEESVTPDVIIPDQTGILYDNEFSEICQDVLKITFNWPRIKQLRGTTNFYVELFAFEGDLISDLSVILNAVRPIPPKMPSSKAVIREEGREPVWPDVFQVKEIELWTMDPPEMVRKLELMFGEQIREYYWVSKDQRAYSKRLWERWSFLTRGYLPSTTYSGQMDYVTMRELSTMLRYDTIDAAIKALLANFLYADKTDLRILLNVSGGYSNLSIIMDVWGHNRLHPLTVSFIPMKTCDLAIEITCV